MIAHIYIFIKREHMKILFSVFLLSMGMSLSAMQKPTIIYSHKVKECPPECSCIGCLENIMQQLNAITPLYCSKLAGLTGLKKAHDHYDTSYGSFDTNPEFRKQMELGQEISKKILMLAQYATRFSEVEGDNLSHVNELNYRALPVDMSAKSIPAKMTEDASGGYKDLEEQRALLSPRFRRLLKNPFQ